MSKRGASIMVNYIRLKRSFPRTARLNLKELEVIEHTLNKAGILLKIEPIEDGIIIYHKSKSSLVRDLRSLLAPVATFVESSNLPPSHVEIFNSLTNETFYIQADNEEYKKICGKVIHILVKGLKEDEGDLQALYRASLSL